MSEFDLTHEIIILEDLGTPLSKSGDEWRYNCFNCEDKRGKPDKKGKLYFNVIKQKGYCFLCHTVFYPEQENLAQEEIEWQKTKNSVLSKFPMSIFNDIEEPKEVSFNFPELNSEQIRYLKNRNPFLLPLKDWLCVKGWQGKDKGVVLPFFYKGKICKYQVRFLGNRQPKYYTSPGPKPLYSPLHIMNNFKLHGGVSEITICEGMFDAVSLFVIGFPSPLAILGDKITPLQLFDIRSLSPIVTKAYVCLDDFERSLSIKKILRKHIPALQEIEIFTKWGHKDNDPENFLQVAIQEDENFKRECSERVSNFIKEVS